MSYKLHISMSIIVLIVAVLVFSFFGMNSMATSDEEPVTDKPASVTLTVEHRKASAVDEAYIESLSYSQPAVQQDGYIETSGSGYQLTDDERSAVECAVMGEAGGEGEKGQMMIAQCILDGCLRNEINPVVMINQYQVASAYPYQVTDEVRESVSKVFDDGLRVTEGKADLWYNPAIVVSEWHEDQQYVTTVGYHRFFWCNYDIY